MQAQWCKQMIEDQKRQLKPKIKRSNTQAQHKVGLNFLGQNFRQAFDFYQNLADRYFELSKSDKRILGAAKKCYVIAAENAIAVAKRFNNDEHPIKIEMNTRVAQNLQVAEAIQQKINSDPTCSAKKVFFSNHDQVE